MRGITLTPLAVVLALTATTNGAAVDVSEYQGICLLHLNAGAANAGTVTTKIQHSEDGSTNWEDVTGAAFTAVATTASAQTLKINADKLRKYVRVVDTFVTATSISRSVTLAGKKQYV
jgi:hypothetical protein